MRKVIRYACCTRYVYVYACVCVFVCYKLKIVLEIGMKILSQIVP